MRVEKIEVPSRPSAKRGAARARLAFPFVALLTLAVELALVERKYAIFGGGFLQSQALDRPGEIAAFAIGLLGTHLLLLGCVYLVMRRLHRGDTPLFYLNFLFFVPAGAIGLLVARFQVLSYFSDAMGLDVMRNLGGGSLVEPLLYVLDDAVLPVAAGLAGLLLYAAAIRFSRLHRRPPLNVSVRRQTGRRLLATAAILPFLMLGTARVGDAGAAAPKFGSWLAFETLFGFASDFDRDGYSFFSRPADSHPFDATRYPLALDVPGNGIDEDGYGGDFRFTRSAAAIPPLVFPARPPHVVLIVLESVRADAIGKVIGGRPITPNLNALAASGTMVPEAYSHVGFTTASGKSIFSGALEPRPGDPSIFRDLKAGGYRIGIFSAAPENFGDISETVAMRASADIYVDAEVLKAERAHSSSSLGSLAVDGRKILREFDRHFASPSAWGRPTFLYFNFQEAHFPYHHRDMPRLLPGEPVSRSEITASNRERVEATYWNAVAYSDRLVGEVVRRLKVQGLWEDSLIVVTGDHGESLFDDGFLGHGHMLNRQQTQIPLILSRHRLQVAGPVGLDDIRRILLGAIGAARPLTASEPVFQYIGSLDQPLSIGFVRSGGRWTTLELASGLVHDTETGTRAIYAKLPPGPLKQRAEQLVRTWERERWQSHLGQRKTP